MNQDEFKKFEDFGAKVCEVANNMDVPGHIMVSTFLFLMVSIFEKNGKSYGELLEYIADQNDAIKGAFGRGDV